MPVPGFRMDEPRMARYQHQDGRAVMEKLEHSPPFSKRHIRMSFGCIVLAVLILAAMGRNWWCEARDFSPWAGDIDGRHNSQHLSDPYTFTHFLHGLGLYGLLWLFLRKRSGLGSRLVITLTLESGWEILENTSFIIQKYREDTLALGYFGDSILNSVSDIVACGLGFLAAAYLPAIGSILLFTATEVLLVIWIRDSLLLNILMLIWPLDSVRQWQLGSLIWFRKSWLRSRGGLHGRPLSVEDGTKTGDAGA